MLRVNRPLLWSVIILVLWVAACFVFGWTLSEPLPPGVVQ
jgi:hypothetical protein